MTTDPETPTARALLEAALVDVMATARAPSLAWRSTLVSRMHRIEDVAREALDALRRADRPDIAYRVETEWHNGNMDEATRDRILDGLPIPDLRPEARVAEGLGLPTTKAAQRMLAHLNLALPATLRSVQPFVRYAAEIEAEVRSEPLPAPFPPERLTAARDALLEKCADAVWNAGHYTFGSDLDDIIALAAANLPAPRPPEPDRTAALDPMLVDRALQMEQVYLHWPQVLRIAHALATPEPAPVADGLVEG